jgi:hypothetical protein
MLKPESLFAVETLIDLGVLSEEGLTRLATAFRGLRAFSGALLPEKPTARGTRGRTRQRNGHDLTFGHDPDSPEEKELKELLAEESKGLRKERKRAPNGSFKLSKEELKALREKHTVKEIAELHGVSPATVNTRLRALGLTDSSKRGRPKANARE